MANIAEKQRANKRKGFNPKSLANLRPFKKSESGNPAGRPPKAVCVTSWLKEYADQKIGASIDAKNLTFAQAAALKAWQSAAKGDLAYYNFIIDRIEGKVTDRVDMTSKGESINDGADIREFILNRIASIAARGGEKGDTFQPN